MTVTNESAPSYIHRPPGSQTWRGPPEAARTRIVQGWPELLELLELFELFESLELFELLELANFRARIGTFSLLICRSRTRPCRDRIKTSTTLDSDSLRKIPRTRTRAREITPETPHS